MYLSLKGYLFILQGRYTQAHSLLERSITLLKSLPNEDGRYDLNIAGAYNYLGESWRLQGNYIAAYSEYKKSLAFNRSSPYFPGNAAFHANYGLAAWQNGDELLAREQFKTALSIYAHSHENRRYPHALGFSAWADVEDGQYERAAAKLQNSYELIRYGLSPLGEGMTLYMTYKIYRSLQVKGISASCLEVFWPNGILDSCRKACELLPECLYPLEVEELRNYLAKFL